MVGSSPDAWSGANCSSQAAHGHINHAPPYALLVALCTKLGFCLQGSAPRQVYLDRAITGRGAAVLNPLTAQQGSVPHMALETGRHSGKGQEQILGCGH